MSAYDPAAGIDPKPIPNGYCRRIVIVDGTNVVYDSPNRRVGGIRLDDRVLNAAGLLFIVYKFLRQGYEVLVTLKAHYRADQSTENAFIFDELEDMEILTFIPEDELNSSLDDEVLLVWAEKYKAAVVSRDKFKDHSRKWPKAVDRRIGFNLESLNFNRTMESGFNLDSLKFDLNSAPLDFGDPRTNVALCSPSDEDYEQVQSIYQQISPHYFQKRIQHCEVILAFIQLRWCLTFCGNNKSLLPRVEYFRADRMNADTKFREFHDEYKRFYRVLE